jgi:O-antigen/teichoic acid export membrane protein
MLFSQFVARLNEGRFVQNVAIVVSGTAGAQAIALAFAPLITRLYGPEAFGILGIFTAIAMVLSSVAALGYPIAIVLPRHDSDAIGLAHLSALISVLTAGAMMLLLVCFQDSVLGVLRLEALGSLALLLPVAMVISTFLAVMSQLVIRNGLFRLKAYLAIFHSIVVNAAKAGIGWFSPTAFVLVMAATLGSAFHAFGLLVGVRRYHNIQSPKSAQSLSTLARCYKDFPLYRAPQNLINAVSQGLPVVLLAAFFGPIPAGFYALARMVMGLPGMLIAQSVGEVFYPRITEAHHKGESRYQLIANATIGLAVVGLIPFAAVIAFGPVLFGFFFGPQWIDSGEYARWLALMLFLNFINRPSVAAVPILGLERGLVVYELLSTGLKVLALYVGFIVFASDHTAVALFAVSGTLAYVGLIAWIMMAASAADSGGIDAKSTS